MSACRGCEREFLWDYCVKRFGPAWVTRRVEEQADFETAMLRECEGPDPDLLREQNLLQSCDLNAPRHA